MTSDKEGPDSVFERELPDADVVISQPFWPAYLTAERIAKAKNLRLAITAGIGSDHVDLDAAIARGITVAEVTFCNSISVAEHAVMQILALVRNFVPSHKWVDQRRLEYRRLRRRAYDVEGMDVGVIAAGRIGLAVLRRMAPFDVNLHYTDTRRLPEEVEQELGVTYHPDAASLARVGRRACPSTLRCTRDLSPVRRKADRVDATWLVHRQHRPRRNLVRDAVVAALKSGQLAGYAGDVWYPQPPPADHPWRSMPHNAMTPHTSGTTLSAQARYAAGTREILEDWFADKPIRDEYLIVAGGGVGRYRQSVLHRGQRRQPGQQR